VAAVAEANAAAADATTSQFSHFWLVRDCSWQLVASQNILHPLEGDVRFSDRTFAVNASRY